MNINPAGVRKLILRLQRRNGTPVLSALAAACALALAAQAQAQVATSALLTEPGGAEVAGVDGESTRIVRVIVKFSGSPVSRMREGLNLGRADRGELALYGESLKREKAPRLTAIAQLGGRVQNTLEHAINGAVVDIPANRIESMRRLPGVISVRRAPIYRMNQAAPPSVAELIGTAQVNSGGNSGAGVAIAYIDSGIDYTHASFDGPGTVAYYAAATAGAGPTVIGDTPGVFPSGPRVKGGYDWLGDTWNGTTNTAVTPDPDPIDNKQLATDAAGHGTQGASAAAGSAVPGGGLRAGSAPAAMLLAYRGCSRISSSCEGSALLNSIDSAIRYALGDPNGGQSGANNPPLPAGTRFIINMSLGANFGDPLVDDLSEASRNAVRAGITVVASAGNSGDIPFISGTPGATDMVLSVAASQPALLTGPALRVGAPLNASYPLITASFGIPLINALTAPLAFAGPNTAVGSNANPACSGTASGTANPGPPVPPIPALGGAMGVADRGVCGFNEKALNIQRAGGSVALIANNALGFGPLGMGAGPAAPLTTIPSYSIGTAEGLAVRNALSGNPGLQGTVTPRSDAGNVAAGINLVDLIADFSSRGPTQNLSALKPDITAPGVNIFMANVGTGTQGNASSGTSFASPLTAGAAALVLSAKPGLTPWQVKAALMNTANPDVFASKTSTGNVLAGITRMGSGRVQADRAVATGTLAYDNEDIDPTAGSYFNASLSFGPQAFTVPGASTVSRTVVVQNLSGAGKTYAIGVAPRFAADLGKGIVFSTSTSSLTVGANATATFNVVATATGSQLPVAVGFPVRLQQTDACTTTTNPPAPVAACTGKFNDVEQDGFVTIDGGANDRVSVPYLMYPRQASQVAISRLGLSVIARNTGVANTVVDVFNLVGTQDAQDQPLPVAGSEQLPIDIKAVGLRYTPNAIAPPLPTGVTSGDVLEFAVSLWRPVDTLRSAVFNIELDTNGDGVTDFTVRNLNTTSNRSAVFVSPGLNGAPANGFFFANAALNSGKVILPVFPSVMGVTANTRIGVRVTSSNGFSAAFPFPVIDRAPDSGAFMYIKPNQLVNTPSMRSPTVAGAATVRFSSATNAANNSASPGDKGLLLLHADNPVITETTTLQLVP